MSFMSGVGGFSAGIVLSPVTMLAAGLATSNILPKDAIPTKKWLISGIASIASGVFLMAAFEASPYATGFRSAIVISSALAGSVCGFLTVRDNIGYLFETYHVRDAIIIAALVASVAGGLVGTVGAVAVHPAFGCFIGAFSAYVITLGLIDQQGLSTSVW